MAANVSNVEHAATGGFFGSLATFWRRRWLVKFFVQRRLMHRYQKSYLGFLWAFLGPLLMVALLTLVFSEMIGLRYREVGGGSALNFGLWLYCGLLPFLAFSDTVGKGVNSVRNASGLVQKVVFPLEVLPFTSAATSLVDKVFGIGALLVVLVVTGQALHWTLALMPLLLVAQVLFILGLAYLMAVVGTFLPDVSEILRAVVRAMFFLTPIIWPVGRIPDEYRFLVDLNPLTFLVEGYRDLILFGTLPGPLASLYFFLFASALFVAGFALFVRLKHRFADLL